MSAAEASLSQLLDILIENALRHGKGEVLVRVREAHGTGALDVEDEGVSIGLADDIFAEGHSGDGGSGIGLALARELVTYHGGQLVLASQSPRTRFTAVFRLASDAVTPRRRSQ